MPSAFHTFKLTPMAPNAGNRPAPILPPTTPTSTQLRTPSSQTMNTPQSAQNSETPTSETRMNPPSLPRSLMTPARDMREGSVSSAVGSARKPRQNLEERDHILMLKFCYDQRHGYKEGTKSQFWNGVSNAFNNETGKILAQMSATVGRLVEHRRRQLADWEGGIIASKPGGELNDHLDQWMEFLKTEDGEAEAERMRQVDHKRRIEEARKEARRQAIAAEAIANAGGSGVRLIQDGPQMIQGMEHHQMQQPSESVEMMQANGQVDLNGYRPNKRKRPNERQISQQLQEQIQRQEYAAYLQANPPDPPKRVVVEGAMTKEDWREVMGNDARLRALESKVDKIELLLQQNNKLLLQLVSNQSNNHNDRNNEEERVPVHLDAEFERDYLSGRYSKTPLPISD